MKQTVDDYIAAFDFHFLIHERLLLIQNTAKSIFPPESVENIYHGVPTFWLNGVDVLSYGAYKKHLTLYIGYDLADAMKKQYPDYRYSKAAMMIPHSEEMPAEVIEHICKAIMEANP